MKMKLIFLTSVIAIVIAGCNQNPSNEIKQAINPVIGDVSFVERFGKEPDGSTDESLRIQTHLEYVERLLRQRDVSHLTTALQAKRRKLLNLLRDYRETGNFPKNHDYPGQRKPCFIDRDGNICAVGFLIEQTSGRQVAEKINSLFQYARIHEMSLPVLNDWVANSGLTLKECAMIQPTYSEPRPQNYIEPAYGITSALLGGANVSLMTINAVQLSRPVRSKAIPWIGLFTGAGQSIFGASSLPAESLGRRGLVTNESQKILSFVNIGIGTGTMILSAYNLLTNREPKKDKIAALSVYSAPISGKNVGIGVTYRRRL